ncbi:MAG: hypothetical protein K8E66_10215 [Phycisphaerales bacterium]|nr:hypothetical protein [Phycisphaerales bacterium]
MTSCVVGRVRASGIGLAAFVCGLGVSVGHAAFTFDDIEFWVGEGTHEAALVIDWNGGSEPMGLAWGYRFDGDATGADMLLAVIAADTNLFGRFASFGFGDVLIGLGYDLDGDGFSINDGTAFGADGTSFAGPSDGATADDPDDHYAEGWDTGFWSYWLGDGNPFEGGAWASSQIGFGDRSLATGDWDGYRFAPGFVSDEPRTPTAAIPTPGAAAALCAGVMILRRRRPDGYRT